jgi:hypothetical protein
MSITFKRSCETATKKILFLALWTACRWSVIAAPLKAVEQTPALAPSQGPFRIEYPEDLEKLRQLKPRAWKTALDILSNQEIQVNAIYNELPQDHYNVKLEAPTESKHQGKLCYAIGGRLRFGIVVIDTTHQDKAPHVTTYIINGLALTAYQPRFSPDGRYIAFILGWPGDFFVNTRLYILDTQSSQVIKVSGKHTYITSYQWSTDSQALAFTAGASRSPFGGELLGNLTLVTYRLQPAKETVVVQTGTEESLLLGYSWLKSSYLFFTRNSAKKAKTPNSGLDAEIEYSVYKWDATTNKIMLVATDAEAPVVAPDGQRIAFFGQEPRRTRSAPPGEKASTQTNPGTRYKYRKSLCIMQVDGTGRRALDQQGEFQEALLWQRDSKHLISVKFNETTSANGVKVWQSIVRAWNIEKGTYRVIGSFEAKQFGKAEPRFYMYSLLHISPVEWFTPLSFQEGDSAATLTARVYSSYKATGGISVQAMDINNGKISPIASAPKYVEADWWSSH